MCGIVGVAGNINAAEKSMFRYLLLLDTVRGVDSTGIVKVDLQKDAKAEHIKAVGLPDALFKITKPFALMNNLSVMGAAKCLIGHNRAATIGKVTEENAHPFKYGTVTGVHNGTLRHYIKLDHDAKEHDTDSKALIHSISKVGIKETWANFMGAAAIVWFDEADNTLNMVRNKERPLYVASNKAGDVLIWASEKWMIEVAASKAKVPLDKDNMTELAVDNHFSVVVGTSSVKLQEPVKLEPMSYPKYKAGFSVIKGGSPYSDHGWAKGLAKGPRETRGIVLDICGYARRGNEAKVMYFIGEIIDSETELPIKRVEIIPSSQSDSSWLENIALGKSKLLCVTKARCRIATDGKSYRIASSNISWVSETRVFDTDYVKDLREKGDSDEVFYFDGTYVNKENWLKLAKHRGGGDCVGCQTKLEPEDAEDMEFVDKDFILCFDCSNTPVIRNFYVNNYSMNGSKKSWML